MTLDELTDAIVAGLTSGLAELSPAPDVFAYRDADERAKPGAASISVELLEATTEADRGNDRLCFQLRWEANCIVTSVRGNPARARRNLAVAVAAVVRQNRWGLDVDPAELEGFYPADFSPHFDEFDVYVVRWTQRVELGVGAWDPEPGATPPTTVFVGIAPEVGPPHIADYIQLGEGA